PAKMAASEWRRRRVAGVSEGLGKRTFLSPWYPVTSGGKVRFPYSAPGRNELGVGNERCRSPLPKGSVAAPGPLGLFLNQARNGYLFGVVPLIASSPAFEHLDVGRFRAQHGLAVTAEPAVEEGGVDPAEVGVELQVVGVEVR